MVWVCLLWRFFVMPPPFYLSLQKSISQPNCLRVSWGMAIKMSKRPRSNYGTSQLTSNRSPRPLKLRFSKKNLLIIHFFSQFFTFWRSLRLIGGVFLGSNGTPRSPLWYVILCLNIGVGVGVLDWLLWMLFVMPLPPPNLIIQSVFIEINLTSASDEVWIPNWSGDQGLSFGPYN